MSSSTTTPDQSNSDDPAQKLLHYLANPYAGQIQSNSVWIAAGYSIGFMVAMTIFFSAIRPYNSLVYAPKVKYADKKHAPPPIGRGIFAWVSPLFKTNEETVIEKVGLDAAIFLRFTRMLRNMFLVLSLVGCGVLIPVHILKVNKSIVPTDGQAFVSSLTPQLVQGNAMWAHVVVSWLFTFILIGFLWYNYRAVAKMRLRYFLSPEYQSSLHARTLWMTNIPSSSRTDEGILKILDTVESSASLPQPAIARNVKELPELIELHEEAVKKLESILAKYLRDPNKIPAQRPTLRPSKKDHRADRGSKVDAIDYLTGRIKELEMEIKFVREAIDKRDAMPYGFATYPQIDEAHAVAYAAKKKHPVGTTIRLAPKPNDFLWKNLSLSKAARSRKRFVSNLWVALLTFFWAAPNAMIAIFLVNLSHLGAVWPAFNTSFNGNPKLWSVIQAIAGPSLLTLVYVLLPIIFRRLSMRAGDLTKTSRERHVTHKLYAFFTVNNLIIFSVFSAIWSFVASIIASTTGDNRKDAWTAIQDAKLPQTIMTTLCSVSTFWVTWILQRNLGAAVDISQFLQLFTVWFARTFMSPTPRQNITWTAPQPFDYAVYYNYYLFTATVALTNATLQPLVLPVTCLYIGLEIWLKKYLLLYVFITKTESGGLFWNILFNRLLFAMVLSNCIEALVIKGCQGSNVMLYTMIPLPLFVIALKIYCMRTFEEQCKYYSKAVLKDPERMSDNKKRRNERVGVKFGHPALHKPLIAPMVHEKSQGALAGIYHGRLDGSDANADNFGDIPMDPMSEGQPGRTAHFGPEVGARNMFEVVPESNLDFSYFKNRADFGDEHGGGGELYGRPQDLVSERSGTPASFMTDDDRTMAGTPPPMPDMRPEEMARHPAYRQASDNASSFYRQRNDSQHRLLSGAQPAPYVPVEQQALSDPHANEGRELFGMDRWRTGGSGYVGISGQAEEEDLGYEHYRGSPRQDQYYGGDYR